MKQTQNQFYGLTGDISNLPAGTTLLDLSTGSLNYSTGNGVFTVSSDQDLLSTENNETNGIKLKVVKDSTGTGYLSRTNGVLVNAFSNGTGGVAHSINGVKTYVTHTGGEIAFVNGAYTETTNAGSGDIIALYADYHKLSSVGTDVQNIDWMIGSTQNIILDNPNVSINKLGAINAQIHFEQTTVVNDECYVALLDIDMEVPQADVTVDGDFSFLYVKAHTATGFPTVTGKALALNIKSTLPSELSGSMQSAGVIDTAIVEYADNADAVAAGLATGTHYRTGDDLKIVH